MSSGSDNVTKITPDLRDIAAAIGKLGQEGTASFTNLQRQNPHAGVFDAGRYISAIFQDRRDAVAQHGMDLQRVFQDMETALNTIADDYDAADRSNAKGVQAMNGEIEGDLTTLGTQVLGDTTFGGTLQTTTNFDSHDDSHPDNHQPHVDLGPDNTSDATAHNTATVTDASGKPIEVNGKPAQIADNTDVTNSYQDYYGSPPPGTPPPAPPGDGPNSGSGGGGGQKQGLISDSKDSQASSNGNPQ
jgi:hypothetical protein